MKQKLLLALLALFTLGGSNLFAQTDVTDQYITNAGFDNCTAETSNVAAKTIKDYGSVGWTNASTGSYTTLAVTAYGSGVKVGDSTTPGSKKDGTTVSGNTLGIIAGWGDNVKIQSDEITLPAGVYTLTVDHYLTSSTNNYGSNSSQFGFVTSGNSYLVSSTTFTASTWTTETVTFTLTESTTGRIQIGLTGLNKSGSGSPAVFYDDVTITWTDPNAAANAAKLETAKYTLNGYIKKATALNSVLKTLDEAINTAQSVYDAANDYAEDYENTVNAATTLNTAITSALSSVTAVSLTNGNFDTTPNNTLNDDGTTTFGGTLSTATSNPGNTKDMSANTGDHGYLYDVTGWTQYSKFNSTAAQGTTSEYGTAMPANGWSTNSTTPPATDMFGGTNGAALHLSAGWNDQARYQQTINDLPSGRYVFYYEVINQHSNTGIASNYVGVNGENGAFYGTTNAFVYSDLKNIEQGVWKAQAFEFDVAKTANINFSVGVTTATGGSGDGAKIWIDNVLVYRIGDITMSDEQANAILAEVETLNDAVYNATDKANLATAKSAFESSKTIDNYNALNEALIAAKKSVEVYKTLDKAITNAESWTKTTAVEAIRAKYTNGEYSNDVTTDNIYEAYQAAEIAALAAAEATDYTSAILNHSFETGDMTGWSAESRNDTGVKENSNGTYTTTGVDGTYLFNSWGGTAENNVYQTIKGLPAGTYQLSALLAGFPNEKLTLAANETTNSVTVSGDKTTGYTVNVVFTLDEAGDVVIKASNTKTAEGSDASFIKADNFTLKAYSDPLAALKEQLTTLKNEASVALASEDYKNVTGSEKTALENLADVTPEETEEAYNSVIKNITEAIATFKNAKAAYDAFVAASDIEMPSLAYVSEEKRQQLDEAISAEPNTAAEAETATANITTALRAYYESHAMAEGITDAKDKTEDIADWNPDNNKGWTNGIGVDNRDNEKYTDASGNPSGKYYDGGWSTNAGVNINMTREVNVPAGKYLLTVTARGSSSLTEYKMIVGENAVDLPKNGSGVEVGVFGHGWDDVSLEFESEGTPLTLSIIATSTDYQQWISFNRFRLVQLEANNDVYAGEEEYAALNEAIAAAEAKTLGFDEGEYAPYNNVAALQALAAAKAIDQTAELTNLKTDVQAAIDAIADNKWTANTEEVNAVHNGMYATVQEGANYPEGWTRTNAWGQMQSNIAGDYATAYYNQPGSLKYGENGVYTMPLKENTAYVLNFAYRSHENNSNNGVTVSVLNGEDGLSNKVFEGNGSTTEWKNATVYFTTGAAGNYVLTLANNGNTWMTNVSIFKAKAVDITIKAGRQYTAFSSSVALDFTGSELTAQIVTDENGTAQTVTKVPANTGVIVGLAAATAEAKTISVPVCAGETDAVTGNMLVAVLEATTVQQQSAEGNINYVFGKSGGKEQFFKVRAAGMTVPANNAYLAIPEAQAKGIDEIGLNGDATGISTIENADMQNGEVYNLQGQKVNRAQKGVYIVNGKKVILK